LSVFGAQWKNRRAAAAAFDDLAADRGALDGDRELTAVDVDAPPAQPGGFPSAQVAQRDQPPQREQRIIGHGVEDLSDLRGGPHRHRRPVAVGAPLLDPGLGPHHGGGRRVAGISTRRAGLSTTTPRGWRR
jgi:hypothetical protein